MTAKNINRRLRRKLKKPTIAEVKQIVNRATKKVGETKYVDGAINSNYDNQKQQPFVLTGLITQGLADYSNRIGDTIKPTSLELMNYQINQGATGNACQRTIIIQGKEESGFTIPLQQILAYTSTASGSNAPLVTSPYKFDYRSNYTVLHDKITGATEPNTAGGKDYARVDHIKLTKFRPIQYIGATTSVATGGIYMYCIADAATNVSTYLNSTYRLRYKDV